MLHNDAAQQRRGEKQASAPEASQKSTRAHGQANINIPNLKRQRSRFRDTNAASLTDRNTDTTHIIHIHGRHSPQPRLDLMTYAIQQKQQHPHGLAKILQQKSKLPTRLARYHPFGEGYKQARSVLRLEQGTEQGHLPRYAPEDLQQNPDQSQYKEKSAEPWHDTWTHQASHTDSDTHSMHTTPPAPRHPRNDSDTMQNSLNEKYRHTESAPWSA